jgi:Regulator of chromosome condensation (RCC1) repeat
MCSCINGLAANYALRTDGKLLYVESTLATQVPILDAATGLPLTDVKEVQNGFDDGCALLGTAKTVSCWLVDSQDTNGNAYGQLGNGTIGGTGPHYRATPVLTAVNQPLTNVVSIANGSSYADYKYTSCAVTGDGKIYCWGDLSYLANDGVALSSPYARAITSDGATPFTGALQVAVAPSYACAIVQGASAKEVWCWGRNLQGSLGLGDSTKRTYPTKVAGITSPTKLVVAYSTTCALEDAGTVRCWGYNADGAAGIGNTTSPVNGPTLVTLMGGVTQLTGIVDVIATGDRNFGNANACALRDDNVLLCWGGSFKSYPTTYGVSNIVSVGAAYLAYTATSDVFALSGDGLFHLGATTGAPDCGLLQ